MKDYYGILHCWQNASEAEIQEHYLNLISGKVFVSGKKYTPAEMKEAVEVLTDKSKRAAYDAAVDQYGEQLHQLISQHKDVGAIDALIGRTPSLGLGMEVSVVPEDQLGFTVRDKKGRDIVERLGQEKDRKSHAFLVKHYRDCFTLPQLAYMGADLTKAEMLTKPTLPSRLVYEYARGNHPAQVDKMFALLDPGYMLDLEAAEGYLEAGNAVEAEKMVNITHKAQRASSHFATGFWNGGYFDDPQKLEEFLASGSKAFSDMVVDYASSGFNTKMTPAQKSVQANLKHHAKKAAQIREAVQAKAKQKAVASGGAPQGADPQPDPSPAEVKADEVLAAYQAEKEVEKIFQEAIDKVQDIPWIYQQQQDDLAHLTNTLNALKYKTLEDYAKFNNPEDPKNLAVATRDLVNNLSNPLKRPKAAETFQTATEMYAQQFKTSWDWKMILGAVVGAVVGFILGAVIGAAAGPGAIVTALAGASTGVVIGATLFGATGAVVGGVIGKHLASQDNALEQATKAASSAQASLIGPH